ncbi:RNASEH2C [Acrasis kona]|uniref:RNASEH2C n=1 Tax=Acrasis kona TaxID=1008807 RepID=A0AAW2YJM0_9EUKA
MHYKMVEVELKHDEESRKSTVVHKMPCKIKYNGQADTETYLKISPQEGDDKTLCSSFRGRPILGNILSFDENTTGFVIDTSDDSSWTTLESFDKITNWSLDRNPNIEEVIRGTLQDWLPISAALHQPLELDEE